MLFACAEWLARRRLAKYYSPPSSRRETRWLPVSPRSLRGNISINEAAVTNNTKMTSNFGFTTLNGKLFNLSNLMFEGVLSSTIKVKDETCNVLEHCFKTRKNTN